MEKVFLSIVALVSMVMFIAPLDAAGDSSNITWHGYLIDTNSAESARKAGSVLDYVQNYDGQTALSDTAQKAGYMLYAGQWYPLDKHGNELALETIKHSIKHKGFYVAVDGKLKGDTIIVGALAEII